MGNPLLDHVPNPPGSRIRRTTKENVEILIPLTSCLIDRVISQTFHIQPRELTCPMNNSGWEITLLLAIFTSKKASLREGIPKAAACSSRQKSMHDALKIPFVKSWTSCQAVGHQQCTWFQWNLTGQRMGQWDYHDCLVET